MLCYYFHNRGYKEANAISLYPGIQKKLFKLFYPIIIADLKSIITIKDKQINFEDTGLSNNLSFFDISRKLNFCYKRLARSRPAIFHICSQSTRILMTQTNT